MKEEQAKRSVYNGVRMKAFLLAYWSEQVLGIVNKSQKMARYEVIKSFGSSCCSMALGKCEGEIHNANIDRFRTE